MGLAFLSGYGSAEELSKLFIGAPWSSHIHPLELLTSCTHSPLFLVFAPRLLRLLLQAGSVCWCWRCSTGPSGGELYVALGCHGR